MGAQFCSPARNGFLDGLLEEQQLFKQRPTSFASDNRLEVAEMLAADREMDKFPPPSRIFQDFEVKDSETPLHELPTVCLVVHRKTGAVRRVCTVRKPSGLERQEQLRTIVQRLHRLKCDELARVLDVFESPRSLTLVMEHCSGGAVLDRILHRQYFAEQESAVLVRHMLQALLRLHTNGLSHGHPSPDSFRFSGDQAHSPLKLVDFGLELKVQLWDVPSGGGRDAASRRSSCLQLLEACRAVFVAPEIARALQARPRRGKSSETGLPADATLNRELLSEAIDVHIEQAEAAPLDGCSLEAADLWSVGAMAFLLLCGYPPFFAPCRSAILNRIDKNDFAFDPPFWSKISEEAKDFVQHCLRPAPAERPSLLQALEHPWILSLAETSPTGSMLSSFLLNLRRYCRTSLVEACAANGLACKLALGKLQDMLTRFRETDSGKQGFLTVTDLRQVLALLGHADVADVLGLSSFRHLRHPGESYIDYLALAASIRARRERLLEEEIWKVFESMEPDSSTGTCKLPLARFTALLQASRVQTLLELEGLEETQAFTTEVEAAVLRSEPGNSSARGAVEVDLSEGLNELFRQLDQHLFQAVLSRKE